MGRLVRKKLDVDLGIVGLEEDIFVDDGAGSHVAKAEPGDGYLERVVKYVPAEIIAFSMIINAILDQAVKNGGPNALMAGLPITMIAWAALLVALILTPIFCWYVQKDGDAWIANALFVYRCPNVGKYVRGWTVEDPYESEADAYESVRCVACMSLHWSIRRLAKSWDPATNKLETPRTVGRMG